MEGKKINRKELELILFTLFFFVWTQFIFFKNVFMREGLSFVWQNIPRAIVMEYFPQISILKAIVLVSVIPFIAGIFIVYQALFRLQSTRSFLLISLAIS